MSSEKTLEYSIVEKRLKIRGKPRESEAKKERKADIRCKFDIKPLTDMNLIKDDLAEVAYFVKQIQK
mgnify:CR=1 FL=1